VSHRRILFAEDRLDHDLINATGDLLDALDKPTFVFRMAAAQYYDITQNDYYCNRPGSASRLKGAKTRMVNSAREIQEIVRQHRNW
jgi:hypothetical protein